MPCHKMQWHQNRKTCSYFNAMPKTVMTSSKQQNEASKKKLWVYVICNIVWIYVNVCQIKNFKWICKLWIKCVLIWMYVNVLQIKNSKWICKLWIKCVSTKTTSKFELQSPCVSNEKDKLQIRIRSSKCKTQAPSLKLQFESQALIHKNQVSLHKL